MIEVLYSIDKNLFLLLNSKAVNSFLDRVMPFITESDNWTIPIAVIWLSLIIFGGKKGRITALLVILVLTLSDQLSSSVIKPLVGRVRPCFTVEGARLLINQSRSASFPSSHAANMAAMATLFSYRYSRYKWIFIFIAAVVAYSRIYVGVHYFSDALGGAVLGILGALLVLKIWEWFCKIWDKKIKFYFKKNRDEA